jgi:hypothetical protein
VTHLIRRLIVHDEATVHEIKTVRFRFERTLNHVINWGEEYPRKEEKNVVNRGDKCSTVQRSVQ